MRISQISSILRDYLSTSKAIGRDIECNSLHVFARMLLCRLLYDLDNSQYAYYNLHKKSLRECSEYLTKEALDKFQSAINPSNTDLMDDKIYFYERCVECDLPTPQVLAVLNPNGLPMVDTKNIPQLHNEDDLQVFLKNNNKRTLMLKRTTGSYGLGMLSVTSDDGRAYDHTGRELSAKAILEHCRAWPEIFMVQDHLEPADSLKALMPGRALGTFRVVTYLRKDSVTVDIPYAFVKFPLVGAINDNFHHGTTGNLLGGIDISSGKLKDAWGKKTGQTVISRVLQHPDTGVVFSGKAIPFWSKIVEIAAHAARSFKELRTVGWDIAVTNSGIFVLEGNWHYDPDGHQLTGSKGIRSEISRIFSS